MSEQQTKHKIVHQLDFSSFPEMLDYISNTESTMLDAQRHSMNKGDAEWAGTDSLETALELARFGWGDGLTKLKKIIKEVKINFPDFFPKQEASDEIIHDVTGHYEDPGMEDSDDPMNMFKFKSKFDEMKYGSVLQRIIIETVASSFIKPETMFLRGAALIALVEQLELYGFRVEVVAQTTIANRDYGDSGSQELIVIRNTIKKFEDHTDYDTLAFTFANASYLRRLIFAVMECAPLEIIQKFSIGGSYGLPHNHPLYIDPLRDFYMVRPLKNESLQDVIAFTVKLINDRYKGIISDNYNPDLSKEDNGGNYYGPQQN